MDLSHGRGKYEFDRDADSDPLLTHLYFIENYSAPNIILAPSIHKGVIIYFSVIDM